jgi:ligand-binding sensor domain-containing protein
MSVTLGLVAVLATAPIDVQVHTATRDVRSCRALDHGYVAATDGGLVFLDDAGHTSAPLTALDGLPETRSYVVELVAGHAEQVGGRGAGEGVARPATQQQVWVGTEGGLARVERTSAGARVIEAFSTTAPVRAIIEHGGRTFVGTWGQGVLELRGKKLRPILGPELAKADRVTDLVVHDNQVVVATAGAGAWIIGEHPQPLEGVDGVVWSLAVHQDALYAGTFAGVRKLDGAASITVSTHDARALASVGGELLIGSTGHGLAQLGSDQHIGPPISHIQGFDQDRCVASSEGLWIRDGERWVAALDDGLPSGDVTDLLRVDDRLYAATFDKGVLVNRGGQWTPVADPDHVIDPQVNALAPADNGRVWVATARGLHRVGNGQVETWTSKRGLPNSTVLSLAVSSAGELLVGTHSGVAIIDAKGDVRELGSRARRWATWAIAEAPNGELWLGTTQGLIRWKLDGSWDHLSMLSGHLSDNWVTALLWDGDALHVGTYASGVDTLTRKGTGWQAKPLGGGRVNPGGLSLIDGELNAATMKGARVRRGGRWIAGELGVFEDVTRVIEDVGGVWIGSRRGLVWRASADVDAT